MCSLLLLHFRYGTADKCTSESNRCTTLGTSSSRWKRLWNTTCCTKGKRFFLFSLNSNAIDVCLNFLFVYIHVGIYFFHLFSIVALLFCVVRTPTMTIVKIWNETWEYGKWFSFASWLYFDSSFSISFLIYSHILKQKREFKQFLFVSYILWCTWFYQFKCKSHAIHCMIVGKRSTCWWYKKYCLNHDLPQCDNTSTNFIIEVLVFSLSVTVQYSFVQNILFLPLTIHFYFMWQTYFWQSQ